MDSVADVLELCSSAELCDVVEAGLNVGGSEGRERGEPLGEVGRFSAFHNIIVSYMTDICLDRYLFACCGDKVSYAKAKLHG